MHIKQYNSEYNRYLKTWLEVREMKSDSLGQLPENGLILFDRTVPIAAGFIRKAEGGYGLLDSLITNPTIPGEIRNAALDQLVPKLLDLAKELNIYKLLAFSIDLNTLLRSERHGFVKCPHIMIINDLNLPTNPGV